MNMIKRSKKLLVIAGISLLIAAVLVFCWTERVFALSEENIRDPAFREYVIEKFDADGDGAISEAEADSVTVIKANGLSIESLDGIELFRNLEILYCRENLITSLDMSGNPALKTLDCKHNEITSLELSQNRELISLDCFDNDLDSIDLSSSTKLESLTCGSNRFNTVDLSRNTELKSFAYLIGGMEEIDFSANSKLEYIWISTTPLKRLDLGNNHSLKQVLCYGTDLTTIELTDEPQLTGYNVNVSSNKMISIHSDISGGADVFTENQRPVLISVPDGTETYDLRNIDPHISRGKISDAEGAIIENAVVYGIYDGMEVTYTYTENEAVLNAKIIFRTENGGINEPSGEQDTDNDAAGDDALKNGDVALNSGTADTGDMSGFGTMMFLFLISAGCICILIITVRKHA